MWLLVCAWKGNCLVLVQPWTVYLSIRCSQIGNIRLMTCSCTVAPDKWYISEVLLWGTGCPLTWCLKNYNTDNLGYFIITIVIYKINSCQTEEGVCGFLSSKEWLGQASECNDVCLAMLLLFKLHKEWWLNTLAKKVINNYCIQIPDCFIVVCMSYSIFTERSFTLASGYQWYTIHTSW